MLKPRTVISNDQISECHLTHFQISLTDFLPLGNELRKKYSLFIGLFSSVFLLAFFTPICYFSLILQALWGRGWFVVTLLGSYIACSGMSQSLRFLISWVNCTALRKIAIYFLLHFAPPCSALGREFATLNTLWTCQCPAALSSMEWFDLRLVYWG